MSQNEKSSQDNEEQLRTERIPKKRREKQVNST